MEKVIGRKYDLLNGNSDKYTKEELIREFDKYRDLFGENDFIDDKDSLLDFYNDLEINNLGMIPNYIIDNPNTDIVKLGNTMTEECLKNNKKIGLVGLDGFIYADKNIYVKEKCNTIVSKNNSNENISGMSTNLLIYNEMIDTGIFKLIVDYNRNNVYFSYFTNEDIEKGYNEYKATYPVGFEQFKFEFAHGLDYPKVLKQTMEEKTGKIVMSNNPLISNLPVPQIKNILVSDRSKFSNKLIHMGMYKIYENANEEIPFELENNDQKKEITNEEKSSSEPSFIETNEAKEIVGKIGELENEEKMLTEKLYNVVREKAELKLKLKINDMNKEINEEETNKVIK